MILNAIQTHPIKVGESLIELLDHYLPSLEEKTIVAITSKIVSLCEGNIISKQAVPNKKTLIKQEADAFLETQSNPYDLYLTIKDNLLIPSAGIDESNGDGHYILYPKNIQKTASQLWNHLKKKHQLKHIGILITDSHTTPLRRGVTGISLGWFGFEPLHSYIGKADIFGTPLRVTQINLPDALAASAVLMMGEGAERTPIVTIKNAPKMHFFSKPPSLKATNDLIISIKEDLYSPLLNAVSWKFNHPKKEEEA